MRCFPVKSSLPVSKMNILGYFALFAIICGGVVSLWHFLGHSDEGSLETKSPKRINLPEEIRTFLEKQRESDLMNKEFSPNVIEDAAPEYLGPDRTLLVLHVIASTAFGAIFSTNDPELVIKYEAHCRHPEWEIHPLIRDFSIQAMLENTNVSPNVVYLSPSVALPISVTRKTSFTSLQEEDSRRNCIRRPGSGVRFMVMERMQTDMWTLGMIRSRPLYTVMKMLREMLVGIAKLHALGIVHGDIHPGNVMLTRNGEVRFIDFADAFFESEFQFKDDKSHTPFSYIHCFFSEWRLEGFRYSFRDDVFNAVFIAAFLLNGKPFMQHCMSLQSFRDDMYRWKKEAFIFEFSEKIRLDFSVKKKLERILQLTRSVVVLDQRPPIGEIIKTIDEITDGKADLVTNEAGLS